MKLTRCLDGSSEPVDKCVLPLKCLILIVDLTKQRAN